MQHLQNQEEKEDANEHIQAFERLFEATLPVDYRLFLLNHVAALNGMQQAFASRDVPVEFLVTFFTASELSTETGRYGLRMPYELIPIGSCPSGNLVCLAVTGELVGRIYFWDSANELPTKLDDVTGLQIPVADVNDYWSNLHFVAESFMRFREHLTSTDQS